MPICGHVRRAPLFGLYGQITSAGYPEIAAAAAAAAAITTKVVVVRDGCGQVVVVVVVVVVQTVRVVVRPLQLPRLVGVHRSALYGSSVPVGARNYNGRDRTITRSAK